MIAFYIVIFLLSVLYLCLNHVYGYWSRRKFPHFKATIPFGNIANCCLGRKAMGIDLYDLYKQSTEPIVGIYFLWRPVLLARDAQIVKNILTTNFSSFYDRGIYHNPKDPIADNMLMLPGQEWKRIRTKLTPTFTSGKLKGMMPTIIGIGKALQNHLTESADSGSVVEVKDLLIRYQSNLRECECNQCFAN